MRIVIGFIVFCWRALIDVCRKQWTTVVKPMLPNKNSKHRLISNTKLRINLRVESINNFTRAHGAQILTWVAVFAVLGIAMWHIAEEQLNFERMLPAGRLADYRRLVEELKSSSGGDLVLAHNGRVYYVQGRNGAAIMVRKDPLDIDQGLVPNFACRSEVVGIVRQNNPDYDYFLMRWVNQVR